MDAPDTTVMYVFANRSLGMTSGKLGAQCIHAGVAASRASREDLLERWLSGSHAVLVMQARNAEKLEGIARRLEEHGLRTFPVIDEGRTELEPGQLTTLGVEVVDKADEEILALFKKFQVYQDA